MKSTYIVLLSALTIICNTASSQFVINELLASNQNDILDQNFQSEDWIEIYNSGPTPANLAGYYLSDDPALLTKYQFPFNQPSETFLTIGGFIIIWADADLLDGWNHADFKLTSDGETLYLTDPNGLTIIDEITFPIQQADISYGRVTDGAEEWVYFNNTTPEDNNAQVLPAAAVVYINEVLAFNTNGLSDEFAEKEGWVEIYNPNNFQVNLAGYHFGTPGDPDLFQIPFTNPTLTTVDANGFLLFWMDSETNQGESHVGFELNIGGGDVLLSAYDGSSIVSLYNYPAAIMNQSWGRVSDGGVNSQYFAIPTPRYPNGLIIIEPETLYINEVLSDNVNDTLDNYLQSEDWFEIYNPNNFAVNIGGYYLTDNPAVPMKYKIPTNIPDSTTIPAGSWMLFWADEDTDQGFNHVSFRLNNLGEQVLIFGLDGFSLVDEIAFTAIPEDNSFGRFTDGSANWVTFLETTPDTTNNGAITGIGEFSFNHTFLVYPNPAIDWITLPQDSDYQLFDSKGILVSSLRSQNNRINLSGFASGLYLLRSQSGDYSRFILE